MKKVIRNGQVAVLYSPGFGAGWYTWHGILDLVFDPSIVTWVEEGTNDAYDKIEEYVTLKYPDAYIGGLRDLSILWLPNGTEFRIEEYDGNEKVEIKDKISWIVG